jgi:hypothetical protein
MKTKFLLVAALFATNVTLPVRADIDVSIAAEIRIGRALPPPPPEVVIVEHVGPPGPPPWAARRWYRRNYAYYYYPEADVYFRPSDKTWFYLDGRDWHVGARLPDALRIDFGHSVSLTLESDRPYVYHEKVVTYYPRAYFSKVRIKERHDNRVERRDDRRDDRDDRRDDRKDDRADRRDDRQDDRQDRRDDRRDDRKDRRDDNGKGKGKGRDN